MVALGLWLAAAVSAEEGHRAADAVKPVALGAVYSLEQFGPVATRQAADATFARASAAIKEAGGGVLLIPAAAASGWTPANTSQEVWRQPEPPKPAKRWGYGPGVTVLDTRGGTVTVMPPQMTGFRFERTLDVPQGQSSPHWDYHPMLRLDNKIVRGSTSYRDWLVEDVTEGTDRRFYVRTIRGVFPGMFLNTGDRGKVSRLHVKRLGYDREKNLPYLVADVDQDVRKGALLHNKTHVNVMRMETFAHTENQTFDVMNWRHDYSQGDTYMYDALFSYMSDVHSTAGDENGVLYAAFVRSETNPFRGKVESWAAGPRELKYTRARNAHTPGTGRPVINLNPKKWITEGAVWIVRPASWWNPEAKDRPDPVFRGRSYPTTVGKTDFGTVELKMGGLIRFTAEAPITAEAIGRYFAVTDPAEIVPGTRDVRRWYLIDGVTVNEDGTKDITIVRHWWGAKSAGSPTLYNPDNYSRDGHEKALEYVIAPGSNVYDVSRGVKSGVRYTGGALDRIIKLAPGPHEGTPMDFAPGDPIGQAIGPDPFRPIPFRSWLFEKVPGAFPAPVLDIANHSAVSRYSVMTVAGGPGDIEKCRTQRADKQPAWENIFRFESAAGNGIVFNGDTGNAALMFNQPNGRAQPIKWRYADGKKEATLTVSPADGTMRFDGGGLAVPGGLSAVRGISGTETKANNLRGINVPVKAGATSAEIAFPRPEADANYAIFVELSWLSAKAVTNQTQDGFTVAFAKAPEAAATLHWLLVR